MCQIQHPLSGHDATNVQGFLLVQNVINLNFARAPFKSLPSYKKMHFKIVLLRCVSILGFGVYVLHTDVNFGIPLQAFTCSKAKLWL
jgi:hypothetical protein